METIINSIVLRVMEFFSFFLILFAVFFLGGGQAHQTQYIYIYIHTHTHTIDPPPCLRTPLTRASFATNADAPLHASPRLLTMLTPFDAERLHRLDLGGI